jgi:hypothetical protein
MTYSRVGSSSHRRADPGHEDCDAKCYDGERREVRTDGGVP